MDVMSQGGNALGGRPDSIKPQGVDGQAPEGAPVWRGAGRMLFSGAAALGMMALLGRFLGAVD